MYDKDLTANHIWSKIRLNFFLCIYYHTTKEPCWRRTFNVNEKRPTSQLGHTKSL